MGGQDFGNVLCTIDELIIKNLSLIDDYQISLILIMEIH